MALSTISGTTGITDATITSAKLADFSAAVDLNGVELLLDADQDTSITADTDDRIDFKIAGVEHISISNSSGDTIIKPMVNAKDIVFQQYDGNKILEINDGNYVAISGAAAGPGELRFYEDTDLGSHYTGLKAGNATASVSYVLPLADGTDGYQLTTDGSGTLSWAAAGANPPSADGDGLGTASLEWSDLYLADGGVIYFGNDQDVTLTHVADTGILLNSTMAIQFNDSSQYINAPSNAILDINATDEIELNATLADVNANLDVSGTIVGASTISGTTITASTAFVPDASDGAALGTTALEFSDLFLADGAVIQFGDDQDVSLTHVADTGLLLSSTDKLQFNDASQFIHGSSATVLSIGATDEIDLTATAIDINGTCDISGTFSLGGTNITSTAAEINLIDGGATVGTTAVADGDGILHNDGGAMKVTTVQTFATYFGSEITAMSNLVTTGALDSGSITSGFGAIDNGTSNIRSATITAETAFVPDASGGADLGTTSLEFNDAFFNDAGSIKFGDDQDVTLTHVADTGLLLNSTMKIQFNDASQFIHGSSATVLSIGATDEIDLTATAVDLNGTLDVSGATLMTTLGVITAKDLGVGVHIRTADSGASVHASADELVIENNGVCGLSILSSTSTNGAIMFGDSGGNARGRLTYSHSLDDFAIDTAAVEAFRIQDTGQITTGGETAADVGAGGLCLDQNAIDTSIMTFKSSDVANGMTDNVETDTFFFVNKETATEGGVSMTGVTEGDCGFRARAFITTAVTTRSTSAEAPIDLRAMLKSGTGLANMSSDANLCAIKNNGTTRFIFDAEGSFHADVESTTYDTYDDAQLVRAFDLSHGKGTIDSKFDKFIAYNHEHLAELKLVGREEDGTPNHFVNVTGMQRLHNGAIWQQYEKHNQLLEAVYDLAKEAVGEEKANAILDKHEVKRLQ